jgi:Cft2 family RNA processing exonuclease
MAPFSFTRLTRSVEIGANCYVLELGGRRLVLDCGMHPKFDGADALPQLELLTEDSVDAVVITHAHQDHIGALPVLQRRQRKARVFMTEATRQLGDIMLHNSVNVMQRLREQGIPDAQLFGHREVDTGMKKWQVAPLETRFDLDGERLGPTGESDVALEFFDAGHILGSVGVRIRAGGRTIFYTGDVQFEDQTVSRAATFPTEPVDLLIMECTRGDRAKDPAWSRAGEEQRLADSLREVFGRGGGVLIPTFALGKTQELLAMIYRFRREGQLPHGLPVYIGGLSTKLTEVHDRLAGQTRRNFPNLRLLDEVAPFVLSGQSVGDAPMRPKRIYALSSGMMSEHTVSNIFARRVLSDANHALFFIGYSDPDSPAGVIQRTPHGALVHLGDGAEAQPLNCELRKFDFSGHAPREDLRAYAAKVHPKKVLMVHGSPAAGAWFADALASDVPGCLAATPDPGVPIEI